MITLKKVSNEFDVPKIRESFMRQFLGDTDFNLVDENMDGQLNSSREIIIGKDSIIKSSTAKSFKNSKFYLIHSVVNSIYCNLIYIYI